MGVLWRFVYEVTIGYTRILNRVSGQEIYIDGLVVPNKVRCNILLIRGVYGNQSGADMIMLEIKKNKEDRSQWCPV